MQRGIWTIWLNSNRAKRYLLENVKVLQVDRHKIDIYEFYPNSRPIPNEKILFRDLPLSMGDSDIIDFLNLQPGITVKSGIIAAKIRDENNKLTSFYSGDRFVYVKGKFTTALHTIGLINFHKCRIWHQSQARACIRCRQLDHTSTDTESCPAYTGDTNIIMIRSANYAMCNYYMCNLRVFEMDFRSSEQAYQWRFMKYLGMDDLAQEIFEVKTPEEAKEIASRVPNHMHKDWHSIQLCIMK